MQYYEMKEKKGYVTCEPKGNGPIVTGQLTRQTSSRTSTIALWTDFYKYEEEIRGSYRSKQSRTEIDICNTYTHFRNYCLVAVFHNFRMESRRITQWHTFEILKHNQGRRLLFHTKEKGTTKKRPCLMTDLKEGNSLFIPFASADYEVDKVSFRGRNRRHLFVFRRFYCSKLRQSYHAKLSRLLISTRLYDGRFLQDIVR